MKIFGDSNWQFADQASPRESDANFVVTGGTAVVIKTTCGATSYDNVDIMRQTAELSHYVQHREVGIWSWKFSKNNLTMCSSGHYKPILMKGCEYI